MRKKQGFILVATLLLAAGGAYWWIVRVRAQEAQKPTYQTAKVERTTVSSSISATGVLQPYLIVDVKSKAGGRVDRLLVEVGTEVEKGQLLAKIDPSDTLAAYNQARADLEASKARILQAQENLLLQKEQSESALRQASAALNAARARLSQAEERARAQPALTESQLSQAQASYETAKQNLAQLKEVTIPQTRAQAEANFNSAKAQYENAQKNYQRLLELLKKGYVSQQQVDNAQAQLEAARSGLQTAQQRLKTLEQEVATQLAAAEARLKEAEASLTAAEANRIQVKLIEQALQEARAQYQQAEANLAQAQANLRQIKVRTADITTAKAQQARAEAQLYNARVQLESTTITAPRSGVVIKKFVEEGTIIPPGTSVFSQGTTLLQIADTTRMFVDVSVDEADIAAVEEGQTVDVTVDAYPDEIFEGKVTRIEPQAVVEQNVTVVHVRVEVLNSDARLKPGMNATCEFILKRKENVLAVPNEAVKESADGHYVEILVQGKPQRRPVTIGIIGNDKTEINSGLQEGETVITKVELPEERQAETSPRGSPFGFGFGGRPRGMR